MALIFISEDHDPWRASGPCSLARQNFEVAVLTMQRTFATSLSVRRARCMENFRQIQRSVTRGEPTVSADAFFDMRFIRARELLQIVV